MIGIQRVYLGELLLEDGTTTLVGGQINYTDYSKNYIFLGIEAEDDPDGVRYLDAFLDHDEAVKQTQIVAESSNAVQWKVTFLDIEHHGEPDI